MLLPIDDNPAIVRTAMSSAVNVVDACGESTLAGEKGLAEGVNCRVWTGGDVAVEIIVADDLYQSNVAVRHGDAEGKDFVVAVRASVLRARRAYCDATDHDVVHGL